MAFLSRSDILSSHDVNIISVHVPEWNGDVCLRTLTLRSRDELDRAILARKGEDFTGLTALWAVKVLCTQDGLPLFTDADIPELSEKSAEVLRRLVEQSKEDSGLRPQDLGDSVKN